MTAPSPSLTITQHEVEGAPAAEAAAIDVAMQGGLTDLPETGVQVITSLMGYQQGALSCRRLDRGTHRCMMLVLCAQLRQRQRSCE